MKHLSVYKNLMLIFLSVSVLLLIINPVFAQEQSYRISSGSLDGELKSKGGDYGQYRQGDKGFNRGVVGGGNRGYEYVVNTNKSSPGKRGARGAIDGEPDIGGSSKGNTFTTTALSDTIKVGQALSGNYEIYKAFLSFDTTAIPYEANINGATLTIYTKDKYINDGGENFDIQVYKSVWTEPLWNPDWGAIVGQERGSVNTSEIKIAEKTEIAINALHARYLIEKGGITKIALVSSKTIDQVPPNGSEYIEIYSSNADNKEFRPVLDIDYEGDAPNVKPSLTWTGETYYKMNGVFPEEIWIGENSVTFKVQYTHPLDIQPNIAQVWIDINSDGDFNDPGENVNMKEEDVNDQDFSNGKNYYAQVIINSDGVSTISYRFMFTDENQAEAIGAPASIVRLATFQSEEKSTCFISSLLGR